MVELPDHPFFVASQFHPEFNSRPNRPEPLFREFVGAATTTRAKSRRRRRDRRRRVGRPGPDGDGIEIGISRSAEHSLAPPPVAPRRRSV